MGETLEYLENSFPDEPEQWGGSLADIGPSFDIGIAIPHPDDDPDFDDNDWLEKMIEHLDLKLSYTNKMLLIVMQKLGIVLND